MNKGIGIPKMCAEGIVVSFYHSTLTGIHRATITMEMVSPSISISSNENSGGSEWRPVLHLRPEIAIPALICQSIFGVNGGSDINDVNCGMGIESVLLGARQSAKEDILSNQSVAGRHYVFRAARNASSPQVGAGISALSVSRIPIQSPEQIPDIISVCEWFFLFHWAICELKD